MSRNGQNPAVLMFTYPMSVGDRFTWHAHDRHQVAWAASGVLTVQAAAGTWVLPPTRALWIPAGVEHETSASSVTMMRSLYFDPTRCAVDWQTPQPVAATPLLGELIAHLSDSGLEPAKRRRAEAVLLDLLEPVAEATIEVTMPTDPRALDVARALMADPADHRTLVEWGREVGASARTLTRAFLDDTGVSFSRWRTAVRLRAALGRLADGEPIANVAWEVGYGTPSAFVAAFRRETGMTPGAYFRA